ncbi:S26 family signal peptidase [Streptomyces sp. NPDC020731]|uniref:S26 family signal peptidase n=1 Tax=Streptomyces sp. NPDC020731 TaxID=3365085 RepID=UPI0037A2FC0E
MMSRASARGPWRGRYGARTVLLAVSLGLWSCAVLRTCAGDLVFAGLAAAAAFTVGAPVAVGLFLGRRFVIVTVHGASMLPTYRDRDRVLVRRRPPVVGEAVVVEQPSRDASACRTGRTSRVGGHGRPPVARPAERRWLIKRVTAVAGDPVPHSLATVTEGMGSRQVPAGRLVLLGDNPAVSVDSRTLGLFRADRVLGVVVRRLPRKAPVAQRPGPPASRPPLAHGASSALPLQSEDGLGD